MSVVEVQTQVQIQIIPYPVNTRWSMFVYYWAPYVYSTIKLFHHSCVFCTVLLHICVSLIQVFVVCNVFPLIYYPDFVNTAKSGQALTDTYIGNKDMARNRLNPKVNKNVRRYEHIHTHIYIYIYICNTN